MRTVEGDNSARLRLADSLRALGLESVKRGGRKLWNFTPAGAKRAAEFLAVEAEAGVRVAVPA